jgi:hypothetical protein
MKHRRLQLTPQAATILGAVIKSLAQIVVALILKS